MSKTSAEHAEALISALLSGASPEGALLALKPFRAIARHADSLAAFNRFQTTINALDPNEVDSLLVITLHRGPREGDSAEKCPDCGDFHTDPANRIGIHLVGDIRAIGMMMEEVYRNIANDTDGFTKTVHIEEGKPDAPRHGTH